jgi:two-component sensor histidine kinase
MAPETVVLWLQDITARKRAELTAARRAEQLDILCRLGEEMGRERGLREFLRLALRGALDLVSAAGGSISLWDETAGIFVSPLRSELSAALDGQTMDTSDGVVGQVAASRSGVIVNDYRAWPGGLPRALAGIGVTASMAEPLLHGSRLIGVIHLVHTSRGATFSDQDASLLRTVATEAGVAIENARLLRKHEQADCRLREALTELHHAVADRETLLREVHHRTKNNLQMLCDLLYLQIEAMDEPERHPDLTDAYGRIYAFARLHEALHHSLHGGQISLGKYLAGIAEGFRRAHPGAGIRLEVPVDDLGLDLDRTLRVGLILNELLVNALKHAFPTGTSGEVGIAARRVGGQIEFRVWDGGKGLPAGADPARASTLGFRIVTLFARQLGAQIRVGNGPGTSIWITFPRAAA